jgi:hypothetical protein
MKLSQSLLASVAATTVLAAQCGAGTTNLYAPYNVNNNLTIGSPSGATVNGTVTAVTGFTNTIGGNTGNAVHFDYDSSLDYGSADSYVPDFGNSIIGVKSNTFRLLFKPDFSGNPTTFRANFLGMGALGAADGIYLAHSDAGMPAFRLSFNGSVQDNVLSGGSGFSWDPNTWYYLGGSLDAQSSVFYIRALTNGSTAFTSTMSYGGPVNWGVGGYGGIALRVGGRVFSGTEGARGTVDEVMIVNDAKWGAADFNYDFAVIIPEGSTASLFAVGLGALLGWRRIRGAGGD